MLRCVVQEYAWLGCSADDILRLFQDPFYPALHGLLQYFGAEGVRARVTRELGYGPAFRVVEKFDADADTEPAASDLVQIGVLHRAR
jgi:hypothetical protein